MAKLRTATCVHRWALNSPSLARVSAVCRRCGARRTYPAGQDYYAAVPADEELDRSLLMLDAESASLVGQAVA